MTDHLKTPSAPPPVEPAGRAGVEGFARQLFLGRFDFSALHPFPSPFADAQRKTTLLEAGVAFSKRCLRDARAAANERGSEGLPIGQHAIIAEKIARLAAETFALEALGLYTTSLAIRGTPADEPLEGVLSRLWATERCREHRHEWVQIRGWRENDALRSVGLGDETPATGKSPRGDDRGRWLDTVSTESARLFIARAMLEPHMKIIAPILDQESPGKARLVAGRSAAWFYLRWYPRQWLGPLADIGLLFTDLSPRLAAHVRWTARASHRLARALFHALAVHGLQLQRAELLLGRLVDLGAELLAIAVVCSRAQALRTPEALELADFFARAARLKVGRLFQELHQHTDRAGYRVAQSVLAGRHAWLETGLGD